MKKSRIDALIMEQARLETVTRQTVEAFQLEKLNELLAREKRRGGFYAGLPERIGNLSQLACLPFTTDEELSHNAPGILLTSQAEIQRVLSDATSGTTGAAKRVFYTEKDCADTVGLFMAGLGEFVFPGSVTMICMPFSGPFGLGELIARAIENLGARPLKVGYYRSYGELKAVLEEERPDTFVGMPVQLLGMLRYCGAGSLKRALVSGDACPDSVTAACEEILGTRLFPHYGSREMGLGGAICCQAHAGMHLRENHVIAEIVDEAGKAVPHGETGELVITTIGMEAMPLIRYRTGDYTRILPGVCPCGSQVLRLDKLHRKGEGGSILALDEALFPLEGILDFFAERSDTGLTVTVLTDGSTEQAQIRTRIETAMPGCSVILRIRKANDGDYPLYQGKRILLRT